MFTAGIDGCKAGWFVTGNRDNQPVYYVIENISDFTQIAMECDRIFIDIPIGLSSTEASRECDRLLRKNIGAPYTSSVFNPPVRQALYCDSYTKACDVNEHITGKRMSKQSWNITSKIREVDQWLTKQSDLRNNIFESHPEWCFSILNNETPIPYKKKTNDGEKYRLDLLEENWPEIRSYYEGIRNQTKRSLVSADDILDSIVLSYFSAISLKNGIYSFPEKPPADDKGLPMGIFYTTLKQF